MIRSLLIWYSLVLICVDTWKVWQPVKWVIRHPQPESFKLETWRLLFPAYANIVCGREHCPTILFTFCILLTNMFCLFRCIEPFPYWSISESESGCLNFQLMFFVMSRSCFSVIGVLWRPRSCRGSRGVDYLAPTTWELQAWDSKTPSYANIVCGREHCPTTWFTFFILLTS